MGRLFELVSTPLDLDAQAARLYAEYPKHESKGDALTAIRAALREVDYSVLHQAVVEFARACKASRRDRKFIPYPATWFRARKWEDDRRNWWAGAEDVQAREAYQRLRRFARRHGLRHPEIADPDFVRAKNVARACGGWQAFCDGKISESQFVAAWKERKTA